VVFGSWLRSGRRKKLLAAPLSPEWCDVLARNVAVYALLPEAKQARLVEAARVIAAERPIVGCKGLVVTEEMKITVAAQAALLLVGETGYYFDRVPSVLLYPGGYVRPQRLGDHHGVIEETELLGESWQRGSIVLSWPAVLAGGRDPHDGQNLVLHEFAHHLDGLDGDMGGMPPLATREAQRHWRAVFDREYALLCDDLADGRPTLLDPYAGTSQAEFFAVATECFFERPVELRARHADLYGCLREFYKVDPADWFSSAVGRDRTQQSALQLEPLPGEDAEPDELDSAAELPPLETADAYFTRGCEHFDLARFDLAVADFNRAVRLAPDDQEAILWRGRASFFENHVEAALADAERACRLDPDDKEAATLRAICLAALGRYEEALPIFDRATDSFTDDVHALFYRGLSRQECGRVLEAMGDFRRVIHLDPLDGEAHFQLAECYDEQGLTEHAEQERAKARELGFP
jgi:Mlc titration factor MtfA (ptsG expression regulator)/Flp pilus assembly protein TadD